MRVSFWGLCGGEVVYWLDEEMRTLRLAILGCLMLGLTSVECFFRFVVRRAYYRVYIGLWGRGR